MLVDGSKSRLEANSDSLFFMLISLIKVKYSASISSWRSLLLLNIIKFPLVVLIWSV